MLSHCRPKTILIAVCAVTLTSTFYYLVTKENTKFSLISSKSSQNHSSINSNAAKPNIESQKSFKIPRVLHQIFSSELVYGNYIPLINSCLAHNPDWKYILWRDTESIEFVKKYYPNFVKKFSGFKDVLQKSDSLRYMILYQFGGVYLDMDMECMKPLNGLIATKSPAFLDQERQEQSEFIWNTEFMAMNSGMGSRAGHPFFLQIINSILHSTSNHVLYSTGPAILTDTYKKFMSNTSQSQGRNFIHLLKPEVLSPMMDWQTNWKQQCLHILSKKNHSDPKVQLSWKDKACATLKLKNFSLDDSNQNSTFAIHRFLHLGYDFAKSRRKSKSNLTQIFGNRIEFPTF